MSIIVRMKKQTIKRKNSLKIIIINPKNKRNKTKNNSKYNNSENNIRDNITLSKNNKYNYTRLFEKKFDI